MKTRILNLLSKVAVFQSNTLGKRPDLLIHFWACFTASLVGGYYGVALINFMGIGKEYLDSKKLGNKWDWMDIAANFIGSLAGLGANRVFWVIINL